MDKTLNKTWSFVTMCIIEYQKSYYTFEQTMPMSMRFIQLAKELYINPVWDFHYNDR